MHKSSEDSREAGAEVLVTLGMSAEEAAKKGVAAAAAAASGYVPAHEIAAGRALTEGVSTTTPHDSSMGESPNTGGVHLPLPPGTSGYQAATAVLGAAAGLGLDLKDGPKVAAPLQPKPLEKEPQPQSSKSK